MWQARGLLVQAQLDEAVSSHAAVSALPLSTLCSAGEGLDMAVHELIGHRLGRCQQATCLCMGLTGE